MSTTTLKGQSELYRAALMESLTLVNAGYWVSITSPFMGEVEVKYGNILSDGHYETWIAYHRYYFHGDTIHSSKHVRS